MRPGAEKVINCFEILLGWLHVLFKQCVIEHRWSKVWLTGKPILLQSRSNSVLPRLEPVGIRVFETNAMDKENFHFSLTVPGGRFDLVWWRMWGY